MNLCPRVYGADMTDPANLDYCREIQRERGRECRMKGCPYCVEAEEVAAKETRTEQVRLF